MVGKSEEMYRKYFHKPFFVPGKTLCKCNPPPTHPPSSPRCGPDFLTAELPASKGMPPLFSQPLKGVRQPRVHPGNVSPTELRPVKFCFFPQPCRRRDTGLGQLTSQLEVLKPTRGARDFLMSPSQAEHWKAASRGVGQRGS